MTNARTYRQTTPPSAPDLTVLTPGQSDRSNGFFEACVNAMGGPRVFTRLLPWTDETLLESYKQDPNFNTDLTPLSKWDAQTGIEIERGQNYNIKITGNGVWAIVLQHGVRAMSQSQAVCLLKAAAGMVCRELLEK